MPPRSIRSIWAVPNHQELDRLDLGALDDLQLLDAAASAAGLRDDARTARLAAELVRRHRARSSRCRLEASRLGPGERSDEPR